MFEWDSPTRPVDVLKHRRGAIILFVTLIASLAALLYLALKRDEPSKAFPMVSSSPALKTPNSNSTTTVSVSVELQRLEAERAEKDRSLWAPEKEAQRHGEFIVALWDRLRDKTLADEALEGLAFDRLHVPTLESPPTTKSLPWNTELVEFSKSRETWSPHQWQNQIRMWRKSGWRLAQSEWRHVRFDPASLTTPARSHVEMDLHLSRHTPSTQVRIALETKLLISWKSSTPETSVVEPSEIEILSMSMFRRTGPPPFSLALDQDIKINSRWKDQRLMVEDLDADGLPEIILPGPSIIGWNTGQFRFRIEPLWPSTSPAELHASALVDFDHDGRWDMIRATRNGVEWHRGLGGQGFEPNGRLLWTAPVPMENPLVLACGDIDQDGDLDFWLAQYKPPVLTGQMPTPFHEANDGFPSYLLLNENNSRLIDATENAGLAKHRFRRTYSASFTDMDSDNLLDLLIIADFSGASLHRNLGNGRFEDVTPSRLGDTKGFGMSHVLADFNTDGSMDLWMAGMNSDAADRLDALGLVDPRFPEDRALRARMNYGNRLFFGNSGATGFTQATPETMGALRRTGWTWGGSAFDADHDGRIELIAVNGHLSRKSAADYDSEYWRHDIHTGNSSPHHAIELVLGGAIGKWIAGGGSYGGHQYNRFAVRLDTGEWRDLAWISGLGRTEDCRNLVTADLDGDGRLDVLMTTQEVESEFRQRLLVFRNEFPIQPWIGVRVGASHQGSATTGTTVTMTDDQGRKQIRTILVGDSYLSQHPASAHFGLGSTGRVRQLELTFPGGRKRTLLNPEPNRWHTLDRP